MNKLTVFNSMTLDGYSGANGDFSNGNVLLCYQPLA